MHVLWRACRRQPMHRMWNGSVKPIENDYLARKNNAYASTVALR